MAGIFFDRDITLSEIFPLTNSDIFFLAGKLKFLFIEPEQAAEDVEDNKMVTGNLMAFLERLDDEYSKSLQSIDPHTQEYVTR